MDTFLKHFSCEERTRLIQVYTKVVKKSEWLIVHGHITLICGDDYLEQMTFSNSETLRKSSETRRRLIDLRIIDFALLRRFFALCTVLDKVPPNVIEQLMAKQANENVKRRKKRRCIDGC